VRKAQIRSAQKKYRLKKDQTLSSLKIQCAELELKLREMAILITRAHELAERMSLEADHAELVDLLKGGFEKYGGDLDSAKAEEQMDDEIEEMHDLQSEESTATPSDGSSEDPPTNIFFGYRIHLDTPQQHSAQANNSTAHEDEQFISSRYIRSHSSHLVPSPTTLFDVHSLTYTHLEPTFHRRLHRSTLQHAYELFTNPSSNPQSVFRIFRLVSCIKDKAKMAPYFEALLRRKEGESLELEYRPFYAIGGAGTHFLKSGGEKHNVRMPKRILGITSGSSRGCGEESSRTMADKEYSRLLEEMGYGGTWFDAFEVEEYLRRQGIHLSSRSSLIRLHPDSCSFINNTPTPFDQTTFLPNFASSSDRSFKFGAVASSTKIAKTHRHRSHPPTFFDGDRFLSCKSSSLLMHGYLESTMH